MFQVKLPSAKDHQLRKELVMKKNVQVKTKRKILTKICQLKSADPKFFYPFIEGTNSSIWIHFN